MPLATILLSVWVGLLVGKEFGLPGIKELTWGQLFIIPVVIFAYRVVLFIIQYILIPILGVLFLYWLVTLALQLPLATGWANM